MSFETRCYYRRLKVFLQIRINEDDREAMRGHWIKDRVILETVVLQLTRLMSGILQSPFVLEDTIKHNRAETKQVH